MSAADGRGPVVDDAGAGAAGSVDDGRATAEPVSAPFPLTDLQAAYVAGRQSGFALGGSGAWTFGEWDGPADAERLADAWRTVAARHVALRTVVDAEAGTQRVLDDPGPLPIDLIDLRGLADARCDERLRAERAARTHETRDLSAWPLLRVAIARLDDDRVRLFVGFDAVTLDYASWQRLLHEVGEAYDGAPAPGPAPTFAAALAATAEQRVSRRERHEPWWRERLPRLPDAPRLPQPRTTPDPQRPTRSRLHRGRIPAATWSAARAAAKTARLTPSALAATVAFEALAAAVREPSFLVNLPVALRPSIPEGVERTLGVFSSFVLLAVDADRTRTVAERAVANQRAMREALAHHEGAGVPLLQALAADRGAVGAPVAPVVVTVLPDAPDRPGAAVDGESRDEAPLIGGRLQSVHAAAHTPQVALDVRLRPVADGCAVEVVAAEGWLADGFADDLVNAVVAVAAALADEAAWSRPDPFEAGGQRWRWATGAGPETIADGTFVPPRDDLEALLCAWWADESGGRVGVLDGPGTRGGGPGAARRIAARLRDELLLDDPYTADPAAWTRTTIAEQATAIATLGGPRATRSATLWRQLAVG